MEIVIDHGMGKGKKKLYVIINSLSAVAIPSLVPDLLYSQPLPVFSCQTFGMTKTIGVGMTAQIEMGPG